MKARNLTIFSSALGLAAASGVGCESAAGCAMGSAMAVSGVLICFLGVFKEAVDDKVLSIYDSFNTGVYLSLKYKGDLRGEIEEQHYTSVADDNKAVAGYKEESDGEFDSDDNGLVNGSDRTAMVCGVMLAALGSLLVGEKCQ